MKPTRTSSTRNNIIKIRKNKLNEIIDYINSNEINKKTME